MKTDRFTSASIRGTAVLLAGLLIAAGPAAGQFSFRIGGSRVKIESSSKALAQALAVQIAGVQKRLDKNRRALKTVRSTGGEPVYLREEVAGLIDRTKEDLDLSIAEVGEPGLDGLSTWAAEELRRLREELAAQPGHVAALPYGLSTPRAVAVVASLAGGSAAAAAQQETISAGTAGRLLDQLGDVVNRIFVLASHNDLEVELWVGSTPAPQATFSFWSQGRIKGSAPAPQTIPTNGKKDHVLRGLYDYRAALGQGAVTELIAYPSPAGASAAGLASERLDLVNGSSFFCCRFDQQYCQHVAGKKECRP